MVYGTQEKPRPFSGETALRGKTLRDLGVSGGRVLLRHAFEAADTTSLEPEVKVPKAALAAATASSTATATSAAVSSDSTNAETHLNPVPNLTQDVSLPERMTETSVQQQDTSTQRVVRDSLPANSFAAFSWLPDADSRSSPVVDYPQTSSAPDPGQEPDRFADFKFPEASGSEAAAVSNGSCDSATSSASAQVVDRDVTVFSLEDVVCDIEDVPESFFDVTMEDVRTMARLRQAELQRLGDQPMLTEDMRQRQAAKASGGLTRIRVIFPDRDVLQATFGANEAVGRLYELVRAHTAFPACEFTLFTTPPKSVLPERGVNSFVQLKLCPAVNVYYSSKAPGTEFLSQRARAMKADANTVLSSQRSNVSHVSTSAGGSFDANAMETEPSSASIPKPTFSQSRSSRVATTDPDKVPKWFTSGAKK